MPGFLETLDQRLVLGDGAMGTQLYARGVPLGCSYEELNLSRPDLVRAIHREYLEAGAEVLETNTFNANRLRLARFGRGRRAAEINRAGARLAREVAGTRAFVAGSVGPLTGIRHEEEGPSARERHDAFLEQCAALAEGDATPSSWRPSPTWRS